MRITARAPGKLVLLGEYAVLEGAPAMVTAVNRHVVAGLKPSVSPWCEVRAPDIWGESVRLGCDSKGRVTWPSAGAAERFALVTAVLKVLGRRGLLPADAWQLCLDSSALFDVTGGVRHKLGLGSSAAVTVALSAALVTGAGSHKCMDDRAVWLHALLEMHREFQCGRGSGLDLAAALHGGELAFQRCASGVRVAPVTWPAQLERMYVWSGRAASTAQFLQTLYAWRDAAPQRYAARMQAIGAAAEDGTAAAGRGDAGALLGALAAAAVALRQLGDESKIPIFSAEHAAISAIVDAAGGVYKPCGAGGGDLGMAVTDGVAGRARVAEALQVAGYRIVPLATDRAGLVVDRAAGPELEAMES